MTDNMEYVDFYSAVTSKPFRIFEKILVWLRFIYCGIMIVVGRCFI